jgi:hypothetical protein
MPTYKVFNGQTIECDYIFYIDPTNGDDSNDGLTPETAWKSPAGVADKYAVGTDKTAVFEYVKGHHSILMKNYPTAICIAHAFRRNYFVANPKTTDFFIDWTGATGEHTVLNNNFYRTGTTSLSNSTTVTTAIGFRVKFVGAVFNATYLVNSLTNNYTTLAQCLYNCCFEQEDTAACYAVYGNSNGGTYLDNCTFKFKGSVSNYINRSTYFQYCVAIGYSISGTGTVADNSYTLDKGKHAYNGSAEITNAGVYSGTYNWRLFKYRSNFYLRDSVGDYYRISDGALEAVAELAEEDGLEAYISPADLELIRTLDAPVLVGFGAESIAYKAILLDDIQLLIPTGDIDLSLASAINSFVFGDAGDVRRLLSVDRGVTWQYWDADNAEFTEFEGDITDKTAVYAAANDTATLNALTAAQISEIIPPSAVDKHIRFLTVLRQELLSADTRTLSVGIDNARRGYFKGVPASNFEETLFTGSLQIKYTGSGGITELHLLLAV